MNHSQVLKRYFLRVCFISLCSISIQICLASQFSLQSCAAQESREESEDESSVERQSDDKETDEEKTLTAAEVIEKNIDANGGYEVLDSIRNYHYISTGKSDSRTFVYESYRQDGKYWATYQYENGVNLYRGSVGNQAWQFYEGGTAVAFEGEERLEYLRQLKYMFPSTKYFETYEKIEMEGIEEVHDRDAYVLQFQHEDGSSLKKYYDVETFMCVRSVATEEYGNKKQHVIRDRFDFRKVGDTVVAFRFVVSYDGARIHEYEIQELEFDVNIPADKFKMPANLVTRSGVPVDPKAKPGAPVPGKTRIAIREAGIVVEDAKKTAELEAIVEEIMKRVSEERDK